MTGERLLQRVNALLKTRPDIDKSDLFEAIGRPTPSWRSEFLAGKRTTNDLRLVQKIARFFGVTVGYLLGDADRALDPGAATLLATWRELNPRDRALLLQVVASFRVRSSDASTEAPPGGGQDRGGDTGRGAGAPQKGRRR